jgi:hypothetical protein
MTDSQNKSERKQTAAAAAANKEEFEVTSFGRRRKKRNRAIAIVAWVAFAAAVPFIYVTRRLKRHRAVNR